MTTEPWASVEDVPAVDEWVRAGGVDARDREDKGAAR